MMRSMVGWFWVSFISTVVALVAAAYTGIRRKRRAHFVCVGLFVVLLYVTVRLTRGLVEAIDFPEDELSFHLRFAFAATGLLVPVLITGFGYALSGGPRWRICHRIAVSVFVVAVLAATGTGIRMFMLV